MKRFFFLFAVLAIVVGASYSDAKAEPRKETSTELVTYSDLFNYSAAEVTALPVVSFDLVAIAEGANLEAYVVTGETESGAGFERSSRGPPNLVTISAYSMQTKETQKPGRYRRTDFKA
jgi:hypothetical protein